MTEIGEPVAFALGPSTPPGVEFAAELSEVTFTPTQRTALRKAAVAAPHWKAGSDPADAWRSEARALRLPVSPYSKQPAVYLVAGASGADHAVDVKVKVTKSKGISGKAQLSGVLGSLRIEGECPTGTGEHAVKAKVASPPKELTEYRGDVHWGLDTPELSVAIGTSLVELYFVLAPPTASYRRAGVWAEVLRFLFGRVRVSGSDAKAVAARVATHCHSDHDLRYDTVQGAPQYWAAASRTFDVDAYLRRAHSQANCYDQAAAIQVLCGAVGIAQSWLFLNPFGYIPTTNLLGVGDCNNPFFDGNGSPKVVPGDSPRRTSFGNHAFVGHGGSVLDACAGPHTGTETAAEYVASSIDATPALYGRPSPYSPARPGTAADVVDHGVMEAT